MEPCGHKECRRVNPIFKGKGGMGIFGVLDKGKQHTQANGAHKTQQHIPTVVFQNGMVRPGYCAARKQQDKGIEKGQIKGIKRCNTFRGPNAACNFCGQKDGIKISPKEAKKEHDFRGDKKGHAVPKAKFDDRCVGLFHNGFFNNVPPPHQHGKENTS